MADANVLYALDKQSARTRDADGRMRVKDCVLSTAEVNPYLGREIPGWQALGLDANKVYDLYRAPDELQKAVASFEGSPLMIKHVPQTADEPRKDYIGGAVHSITCDGKHLRGDLLVMDGQAIDLIESGQAADLSCGYRYDADMTPGSVGGQSYDGVMRNIQGNHVALVDDGRASGAHVADRALALPTPPDQPKGVTHVDPKENEEGGLPPGGAPGSVEGEQHEQAAMAEIGQALKQIAALLQDIHGKVGANPPAAPAPDAGDEASAKGAQDFELADPIKEGAMDEDTADGDEGAMDEELDEDGDEPLPKQAAQEGNTARGAATPVGAMDAAGVRKYAQRVAAEAVKRERLRARAVEEARRDVLGVLGPVHGLDSAGAIYREALRVEGVDTDSIPKGMAKMAWHTHVNTKARVMGARRQSEMAMDSAAIGRTQSNLLSKLSGIKQLG